MKIYKRIPKSLWPKQGDILAFKINTGKFVIGQILKCYNPQTNFEIVFFIDTFNSLPTLSKIQLSSLTPLLHGGIIAPQTIIYQGDYGWCFIGNLPIPQYKLKKIKSSFGQSYPDKSHSANAFRHYYECSQGLKKGRMDPDILV